MKKTPVTAPISDLFFMVDNSSYWNALENFPDLPEDAKSELLVTAESFCESMEMIGFELNAQEVVEDFLERV